MMSIDIVLIALTAFAVLFALAVPGTVAKRTGKQVAEMREQLTAMETRFAELDKQVSGMPDEAREGDKAVRTELAGQIEKARTAIAGTLQKSLAEAEAKSAEQAQAWTAQLSALQDQSDSVGSRLEEISAATEESVRLLGHLPSDVARLEESFDALDSYVKQTFERKLNTAFRTLDGTMAGVLGEMKDELLHGVSRIEGIEAVVAGRTKAQEHLLEAPVDEFEDAFEALSEMEEAADAGEPEAAAEDMGEISETEMASETEAEEPLSV